MLADYYCLWAEIVQKTEKAVLLFSPEPYPEEIWVPIRVLHAASLLRRDLEEDSYVTGVPYLALIAPPLPLGPLEGRVRRFRDVSPSEQRRAFVLPGAGGNRLSRLFNDPELVEILKKKPGVLVEVATTKNEESFYTPVADMQQTTGLGPMPRRREAGREKKPLLLTSARRKVEL